MLDQITDLIREQARSAGNGGRNGQKLVTVDMLQISQCTGYMLSL